MGAPLPGELGEIVVHHRKSVRACAESRARRTRVSCGFTSCKERRWNRAARSASPQLCALPTKERNDAALTQRWCAADSTMSARAAFLTAKQRREGTVICIDSEQKA